jgi:hypothetical protein
VITDLLLIRRIANRQHFYQQVRHFGERDQTKPTSSPGKAVPDWFAPAATLSWAGMSLRPWSHRRTGANVDLAPRPDQRPP